MKFSVVINTVNRAESLRRTLDALRSQTHDSFEVIVVNGPSTDTTGRVLEDFGDCVRSASCETMNLSKSRNIGIAMAGGDIVAFIDDDAVPEADWLEELSAAYVDQNVSGAGGIVFDHTGCAVQYEYSVSDRLGRTRFDVRPPLAFYTVVGAEPFLYLQGTNMSFRRGHLAEIGGFDEEIEYNFDEVDVCLELIDRGYELCALPGAAVHHKYLASHVRNAKRLFTDPYFAIKNRVYFALRHGQAAHSKTEVMSVLMQYVDEVKAAASMQYREGLLSRQQRDFFVQQVDRGVDVGIERGIIGRRQSVEIPEPLADSFLPFPTKSAAAALRVCFVSQEYPPGDYGGIGRFTADLSSGFATRGHEVHVVTRSLDVTTVDFEDGVWVHRVATHDHGLDGVVRRSLQGNLDHIGSVYEEVSRLHERRALDIVSAPLWAAEGLICQQDTRFPTVTTLMTTMRTIAALHKSWEGMPEIEDSLRLERATIATTRHFHAISDAILKEIKTSFDVGESDADVIRLGVEDLPVGCEHTGPKGKTVEVLFVGRLEFRKGVDVLLEAIAALAQEFPDVHFTLAGKDTINTELGESYRAAFGRRVRDEPELESRVRFAGPVSEEELDALYGAADIFCAPSRYESFGLVLVEAMRYGVPVIGCRAGGMPEIVEHGGNGLLADPGDVESLAECLRMLIGDAALREKLGAQARRTYEERFTLDLAVENTIDAYSRIARDHRATQEVETPSAVIEDRLIEMLTNIVGLSVATARVCASRLLGATGRFDPLVELELAWSLPVDDFIEAAYHAVLHRPPDVPGIALARQALENGTTRALFVRGLARSHIAVDLGIDTAWVPDLMELSGNNHLERLQVAWHLSDAEFVACTYEILFGRAVDAPGLSGWLGRLRGGLPRARLVHELTVSSEGQRSGLETDWLPDLDKEAPKWERVRISRMSLRLRMRQSVARLPILGKLGRRAVRMVRAGRSLGLLPRTAADLREMAGQRERGLVELANAVERHTSMAAERALVSEARGARLEDEVVGMARRMREELEASRVILTDSEQRAAQSANLLEGAIRALDDQVAHQGFLIEQTTQRIDVLQRKSQAMSLDLREQIIAPRQAESIDAHPVDIESYRAKIKDMAGGIRVNVGCGEKPMAGYLNVDFRDLPDVDVVADARELPFEEGSLREIMSAHLVEHFREHQLATIILPHWFKLLETGGELRIICPNWDAMMKRVESGDMSLEDFKVLTFGLQDYDGDDHFAMYTPQSLGAVLEGAGFRDVELLVADRQNGLCPEMELLARRP
jgi:glycogen(starch) synthase